MFATPTFTATDSETQVREFLVAPMLIALGYGEPQIETEFNIQSQFGGLRRPLRADYVVSVDHEYDLPPNRLVIEVKRPSVSIASAEVIEQATVYGAHPSIQASHLVITNGWQIAIFAINAATAEAVTTIEVSRLHDEWDRIADCLGAETLKREFAGVRIRQRLGEGGYGQVFEALNPGLRRTEALKVLQPGAEHVERMRDRFNKGAIGLAALDHPNICRVYTTGVHRARPFYRMEYIPGATVVQYVKQHALNDRDRIALFDQALQGLSHAHEHGVVHCDLKPSNVLVGADGTPKLIDFDFCHIGDQASVTLSQVVATIAYMDPTIWLDARHRDRLADVYSAGLLLWSILTGEELAPGWTPHSLCDGLQNAGAGALAHLDLVLRCIQQNRSLRPQTINAFRQELHLDTPAARRGDAGELLHGAVASFSAHSPINEFGFRFRLWDQTGDLPGSVDFDKLISNLPDRTLADREREFVFRATTLHWSVPYRYVFKLWPTRELLRVASIVLDDHELNRAHKSKPGQSHPARHAIDLLGATDEYRTKDESQRVGEFLLERLPRERRPSVFFHCLDILPRLQATKAKNSAFRETCTKDLIKLVGDRAANAKAAGMRDVGKLLEKLDPRKCGMHSAETVILLRRLCEMPKLRQRALATLASIDHPDATDLFLELLQRAKGKPDFERIALMAIGVDGRYKRQAVAEYLRGLSDEHMNVRLAVATQQILGGAKDR